MSSRGGGAAAFCRVGAGALTATRLRPVANHLDAGRAGSEDSMETLYQILTHVGYTHPPHPVLTVVPMGMVIGTLVFSMLSFLPRLEKYAVTARHCVTLALAAVFPTMLLGYMDWQHYYGGNPIFAVQAKIVLAAVLTVLLGLAVLAHWRLSAEDKRIFGVHVLCFAVLTGIGYFGGELVFGEKAHGTPAAPPAAETRDAGATAAPFGDVRDLFARHCTSCHSGPDAPDGLVLDTYEGVTAGSRNGPVVVAGKPGESELVQRIRGVSEPAMPYRKPPLPPESIRLVTDWVRQGARR